MFNRKVTYHATKYESKPTYPGFTAPLILNLIDWCDEIIVKNILWYDVVLHALQRVRFLVQ